MRLVVILLLTPFLIACASDRTRRQVSSGMILPKSAERIEVAERQLFVMATPIETPTPTYPAGSVASGQHAVCVEFVVRADGTVDSIRRIEGHVGCEVLEAPQLSPFLDSVTQTVHKWTFFGAALCNYQNAEAECESLDAQLRPIDIKLAYRFVFTMSNGKRSVVAEQTDTSHTITADERR